MILGLNAAGLYHFDVDALQPVADRCGPAVDDVLHGLDDQEVERLLQETLGMGRVQTAGYLSNGPRRAAAVSSRSAP
jgi:hypothetical protein